MFLFLKKKNTGKEEGRKRGYKGKSREEGAKAVMKKQKKEDVEEIKNWDEHLNSFHLG